MEREEEHERKTATRRVDGKEGARDGGEDDGARRRLSEVESTPRIPSNDPPTSRQSSKSSFGLGHIAWNR